MRLSFLAQFALFWAVAVGLVFLGGGTGGWSLEEDEASHFLTGLMVRDYLAALCPWPPLEFATEYHAHYPRIGMGHWPPVFYALQGAWMLIFPASRESILVLQAAFSALIAVGISFAAARWVAPAAGLAMAILWIVAPLPRHHGGLVMTELLMILLTGAAVLVYARYLEAPGTMPAVLFGLLAAAALLAKGTGAVLALVPVLSVLVLRRWEILRRLDFWIPAVVVALLCAPWYFLVPGAAHERSGMQVLMLPVSEPRFYWVLVQWLRMSGLAAPLVAMGLGLSAIRAFRTRDVRWTVCLALLVSIVLFRQFVLMWSPRHLVTGMPVLLLAAALAAERFGLWRNRLSTIAFTAVCIAFSFWQYKPPIRIRGAAETAAALAARPATAVLIAGSTASEGALICEIALRDQRPGHTVLRAGKAFYQLSFFGEILSRSVTEPDEVRKLLQSRGVSVIIEDLDPRERLPGWDLVRQTLETYSGEWEAARVFETRFRMWRARPSANPSPL
ncbi:MAG: glycosyltransferase family 39 protein [Bryobacterales bacterium]|nr:glycosyltransferase family 39 protein [Bryobacterales bacterium]